MRTDVKLLTIEDLCRELAVVRRDAGRSHREITAEIERRVNSAQAENAALRERVAVLEGSDVPVRVMEFTVVRVATAGKWFAKGWVNGQIVRGPDALSMGEAVNAYCVALAAAKPAAQEGKEASDDE